MVQYAKLEQPLPGSVDFSICTGLYLKNCQECHQCDYYVIAKQKRITLRELIQRNKNSDNLH